MATGFDKGEKPAEFRWYTESLMSDATDIGPWIQVPTYKFYEEWTGQSTPNFRARIRNGEIVPHTPWRKVDYSALCVSSYNATHRTVNSTTNEMVNAWRTYSDGPTFQSAPDYDPAWIDSRVKDVEGRLPPNDIFVQRAAAKASSAAFDALTSAAESGKTISTFNDLVGRMTRLFTKFSVKRLASAWLEYRYAWRTLWFDIVSFSEALEDNRRKAGQSFSERVGTNLSFNEDFTDPYTSYAFIGEMVTSRSWECGVRGGVSGLLSSDQPNYGANPLTTAWELVQFSFVVDWFISVGTYLETLSISDVALQAQYYQGTQITFKETKTLVVEPAPPLWNGDDVTTVTGSETLNQLREFTLKTRTPCGLPSSPLMQNRLDFPKVLDLAAIMTKMLK